MLTNKWTKRLTFQKKDIYLWPRLWPGWSFVAGTDNRIVQNHINTTALDRTIQPHFPLQPSLLISQLRVFSCSHSSLILSDSILRFWGLVMLFVYDSLKARFPALWRSDSLVKLQRTSASLPGYWSRSKERLLVPTARKHHHLTSEIHTFTTQICWVSAKNIPSFPPALQAPRHLCRHAVPRYTCSNRPSTASIKI